MRAAPLPTPHSAFEDATERARIQANLTHHKVGPYKGFAAFTNPHTVSFTPDEGPR